MKSILRVTLYLAIFSLFLNCSDDKQPGPTPSGGFTITISPESGVPGNLIAVSGYKIAPDETASYKLYVGDVEALFRVSADSNVSVCIPLFMDDSGWPSPPSELQSIKIFKGGSEVTHSDKILNISVLPKAPGSAMAAKDAIVSVTTSIEAIFNDIPIDSEMEQPIRDGLLAMLRVITTEGDSSMAAVINGSSSIWGGEAPNLELVDALLASTGALDYFQAYADGLSGIQQDARKSAQQSESFLCVDGGPDIQLACKMQMYVLLRDFGQQVIAQTDSQWSWTIGLVVDLLGPLGYSNPYTFAVKLIGAGLTISNFVVNKIVINYFPSQLLDLNVVLASDTIGVDEFTSSSIQIIASNSPTTITLNDLIGQILNAAGLVNIPIDSDIYKIILDFAGLAINKMRSYLLDYELGNPGTFYISDPGVFQMPAIVWGPIEVTSPDLVQLFSFNADIVDGNEIEFEWEGLADGEGRIQARTRAAGARSTMVKTGFWITYSGGAFGEEIEYSRTMTLVVGSTGELIVNIDGLPEGTTANVMVTGPKAFQSNVSKTDTLTGLPPGDYGVLATPVTVDNVEYIPNEEYQPVTIVHNETASATVSYSDSFGSIYLIISGLPRDIAADVTVSGLGTNIHITGESYYSGDYRNQLDSLAPGEYTITATAVSDSDGVNYKPVPLSQSVTVEADVTANAEVKYEAPVIFKLLMGSRNNDEDCLPLSKSSANEKHDYWYQTPYVYYSDTASDTTCLPGDGSLAPFYTYGDDCGILFDRGRRQIGGAEPYNTDVSAGSASANMLFTTQTTETSCRFDWNGEASASLPSSGTDELWRINASAISFATFDTAKHPLYYIEIENTGASDVYLSYNFSIQAEKTEGIGTSWKFNICSKRITCGMGNYNFSSCFINKSSAVDGDTLNISYESNEGYSSTIPGKSTIRIGISFEANLSAVANYTSPNAQSVIEGGTANLIGYVEFFVKRSKD